MSDWRALSIYDEATGAEMTFGERLSDLQRQAASGYRGSALEDGLELAMGLHGAGLDREALELLTDLGAFIAPDDVEPGQWPWFHNVKGMALSGLRRFEEADQAYRRMQQLAEALPKGPVRDDLLSTALQNRGVLAVNADQPATAIPLLREALPTKLELQDYVSATDVLTSLALAIADSGDLDEAERMLASVEELASLLRDSRRLAAAFGNRGVLRARRGDHVEAESDFRKALRYSRAEGDPLRELLGILNVASSLTEQERFGEAMRWYRRGARWAAGACAAAIEVQLRRGLALALVRARRFKERPSRDSARV